MGLLIRDYISLIKVFANLGKPFSKSDPIVCYKSLVIGGASKIRKLMTCSALIIILLIIGCYSALQFKYNSLEKSLKTYLINVQGYSEEDIVSVKAKFGSMPKFPVYVIFSDDPDTEYIFTDRDASDWKQLDPKQPQRLNVDN